MAKQQIIFRDLGFMEYRAAWDLQEQLLQENVRRKSGVGLAHRSISGGGSQESGVGSRESGLPSVALAKAGAPSGTPLSTRNYLLFVEHPAVYTLGKSGNMGNVLLGEDELKERNIQFFHTNRGGDITFHGAGQIVGYPILDLEKFTTDIGQYLRNIEEVIIRTLAEYGITGERSKGETGVWIDADKPGKERKICAIGVRCSRWITMHGFAFNVNTDLSYFGHIIPCGISGKQVTSLEKELGRSMDMQEAKEKLKRNFEMIFDAELVSELFV